MSDAALVSICIPTYNAEPFLPAALTAAAQQTYRPLEIVISDHGSTDATLGIVNAFIRRSPVPVRLLSCPDAGTAATNWNYCAAAARGTYLKFLFQDDILYPTCVARLVAAAAGDTRIGFVFSPREILHDPQDAEHLRWVANYALQHRAWTDLRPVMPGRRLLGDSGLLSHPLNKIGEPTVVLLRRDLFFRAGGFDPRLQQIVDWECYLRCLPHCRVAYIDEVLSGFRLHPEQLTVKNRGRVNELHLLYGSMMRPSIFFHLHWRVRFTLVRRITGEVLSRLGTG